MSLFDTLKSQLTHTVKANVSKTVNSAVSDAVNNIGKGLNEKATFKFDAIPTSVEELKAIPEASLDTPYKAAALAVLILCNFEKSAETTYEMLDFLNGPDDVNNYTRQHIKDRLMGKTYKPFSFFAGATPENNYIPTTPYTITVSSTAYSFDEENWAVLYVKSSGADSPRGIKLRKKPSTGQWFVNDIQCLADIRVPVAANPWA